MVHIYLLLLHHHGGLNLDVDPGQLLLGIVLRVGRLGNVVEQARLDHGDARHLRRARVDGRAAVGAEGALLAEEEDVSGSISTVSRRLLCWKSEGNRWNIR